MASREPRTFFQMALIASLLAGCSYSVQKNPAPDVPSSQNYKQSELAFANVYGRVIRPNCVGCHGNGGGINLESYANVKANLSKIYQAAITERKMPKAPNAPLDLGLLNAWIQAGAPETAPGEEPGPTPIPLGPTFASIKYNILDAKCVLCHSPGKPVARIPLVTQDDLLNSPLDLVLPGNPDESGIMLAIRGANPEKLMPPPKDADGKPTGFTKLSDQEIDAIALWITNGAKD
jgi:mono/diheme cytochrome c family protein